MRAAVRTPTPEKPRIVPTLEIEATQGGQYAALRAAEAWNESHGRLDGIGHSPLRAGEIGLAVLYLRPDTTVHDLSALIHALKPHIVGEPTFRFQPHFCQEVAQ